MKRTAALFCLVVAASTLGTGASARDERPEDHRVVLLGTGTAHGFGMAMDGVAGQVRAGWSHSKILDTFYPGTSTGTMSGQIRVGLAEGSTHDFVLPEGGVVTDGHGDRTRVRPGGSLRVILREGRAVPVIQNSSPAATPTSAPSATPVQTDDDFFPVVAASGPADIIPTPQPTPAPGASPEPTIDPFPEPTAPPDEAPATPPPSSPSVESKRHDRSVRIEPSGDPAVVRVVGTGNRYRGVIEVEAAGGTLRAINRVGLETYIAGIAEARGAGWGIEGLKALAVAARSYAAARMTWNDRDHDRGYDICPTDQCQVYFGFDGEFPDMRRAAQETAGEIRTYDGRAILAMYHGNGGGQTETYERFSGSKTHPYLRSVRYEHAEPTFWRRELTYAEIATALRPHGNVPQPIERIQILERGDSPRVVRLRLHGDGEHLDVRGTTFMRALDLWSTWFRIGDDRALAALGTGDVPPSRIEGVRRLPVDPRSPVSLLVLAGAIAALATAATLQMLKPRIPVSLQPEWPPLRLASAPTRPGP